MSNNPNKILLAEQILLALRNSSDGLTPNNLMTSFTIDHDSLIKHIMTIKSWGYDIDMSDIKLEKFMTTEIFVVNENDLVDLVFKIMEWKAIHHLPVVNIKNKVVGIITKTNLNEIKIVNKKSLVAKDIMIKDIITVSSEISILEAKEIMIKNKIGCLPILEEGDLIGILTKRDVEKLEQIPDKND